LPDECHEPRVCGRGEPPELEAGAAVGCLYRRPGGDAAAGGGLHDAGTAGHELAGLADRHGTDAGHPVDLDPLAAGDPADDAGGSADLLRHPRMSSRTFASSLPVRWWR